MSPEKQGQEKARLTKKQLRRLRSQEKQERLKKQSAHPILRKFTELGLAMRITISALTAGAVGGGAIIAYNHFINHPHQVPVDQIINGLNVHQELAAIENDVQSGRTSTKTTAERLGDLAARFVCAGLQPEIVCDPKKLVAKMHVQTPQEYLYTFRNREVCSSNLGITDIPTAYTDALTQDMFFDLSKLTTMPIRSAWQGFVHEALHANSALIDLDNPTTVTNILASATTTATKQRGLRAYAPRPELSINSRECYAVHPNYLEEAAIVDAKRRMMEKLGFSNYESPEYQRVADNYANFVVIRLFNGNYKAAFVFHQSSQAIPFYREVGRRYTAISAAQQDLLPQQLQKAGEAYLSRTVLEGQNP